MQQLDLIPYPIRDVAHAQGAVRRAARSLVSNARQADPSWRPPPFAPERYAELLSIDIVDAGQPVDFDAMLVPTGDDEGVIFLNERVRSPHRRRYSIAHEICHTFFQASEAFYLRAEDRDRYYRSTDAQRLERLCDHGAAELLMPHREFSTTLDHFGFRARALPLLAGAFGVSRQAAAIRMLETHTGGPSAVGFFEHGRRQDGTRPAYRARRVFRSPGFPFLFPNNKSVPNDSVIYRASLRTREMQGEEAFELKGEHRRLKVSAFPLHRDGLVNEPPTVIGVMSAIE